ncbi:MAG: selenide, water dikinase SelD [Armatimonadetes bacterium]|nr:selenide, water dikinase SelD [Armatimonadota bacterium]
MTEVLRQLPRNSNPDLLVGFETSDDAGVLALPGGQLIVQTVDFFTPIVDDPYDFGAIAAANSLSDVYAMGGTPFSVLNISCFDSSIPAEVWAQVLRGAYDKTVEAGATLLGGHSVEDSQPKFGMAVTGLVDKDRLLANSNAKPGDRIYLTKSLGTGILATAAKQDKISQEQFQPAITSMKTLNRAGAEFAASIGARCATDVTGFGVVGHIYNVARASGVRVELYADRLPVFDGVKELIEAGVGTGGADRNRSFIGSAFTRDAKVPAWLEELAFDPQTSGGLAIFSNQETDAYPCIGEVFAGEPRISLK